MELSDNLIRTRGNKFKLVQHHCHYDLKKYNFTNRVIPIFTEFTEASSTADTAGMSRHRLAPYTVHYLKTLLILAISGS